jgi:hypothetical protein
MSNWDTYVRESYDLIKHAETELTVTLSEQVEAYLVHLFAHFMDKPLVNTVPVCVKLLTATTLPTTIKKEVFKSVGDECLLINSMEWGSHRWPSKTYYAEMGQMAYMNRAYTNHPVEELYDELATEFFTATKILRKCKIN